VGPDRVEPNRTDPNRHRVGLGLKNFIFFRSGLDRVLKFSGRVGSGFENSIFFRIGLDRVLKFSGRVGPGFCKADPKSDYFVIT